MNKLHFEHQPLALHVAPPLDLDPARRLLVLVSSLDVDLTDVTRRVWDLADAMGAQIKFLGLCHGANQEPALRRILVTMSAMVNYDHVSSELEVIVGRDWPRAVKSRCHPGDMIVCIEDQHTGLLRGPLGRILQSDLDIPVYILSGIESQDNSRSNRFARPAAWIGSIAIILGFLLLQVKIIQTAKDWIVALELASTAIEFMLIWAWNSLVG
jgi:hypothetical protein